MIQLQYYNKGLTKTQIEQILNNYRLKYTTLTNEINLKLNSFVKTVLNDISPFLENIQEISKEMKNLKEMDNHKMRVEILEQKLKEKAIFERQLQNDIDSLRKELITLKEKKESRKDSSDDLLKDNEIKRTPLSPKVARETRKITFDLNNDNVQSNKESKEISPKKNNNNKNQEVPASKSTILNMYPNSSIAKKEKPKNKKKNEYMMNMQEIARNINNYHNEVQVNRNNQNINKFLSNSKRKINKKEGKSKKKKIDKSKSIDLSNAIDTESKNQKMKINKIGNKENNSNKENNVNNDNNTNNSNNSNNTNTTNNDNNDNSVKLNKELEKEYSLIDEKLEEEIKELEIDEENILQLIEDIKNFEKNNKEMV